MIQHFKEQSTHTGVALLVVIVLLSHVAGINLALMSEEMAKSVAAIATLFGTASAAAKIFLPETPKANSAEVAAVAASAVVGSHALGNAVTSGLTPAALRELAEKIEKGAR